MKFPRAKLRDFAMALGAVCALWGASIASAQDLTGVNGVAPACRVVELENGVKERADGQRAPVQLHAVCGDKGTWLGSAQSYEAAYNPKLQGLAVVLRDASRSRVIFVSRTAAGLLKVDDVSRELASRSGRRADVGLGNAAVSIKDFALSGRVTVAAAKPSDLLLRSAVAGAQTASTSPVETVTLDLAPYAPALKARRE